MVAKIDEKHATVVANAMAPAGKSHGSADIRGTKRATCVCTVAMHDEIT
jgi:hypothetical protein